MEQNLAEQAYTGLFPGKENPYDLELVYTGRLKQYGGNVSLRGSYMEFKLSKKWRQISPEIQLGLIQELMLKLLKQKRQSMYIDLYNNFIKSLHIAIPKTKTDPQLEESFNRVNDRYFVGLVERPNLRWGQFSTRTFGTYDFKTDMITVSTVFKDTDIKYLDYIMYHETLHKQRKFFKSGTKTYYHDARFKRLESVFENGAQIEKELGRVVAKEQAKAAFRFREAKPRKRGFFDWF
jgi:predicted metal-dependent hydrolase